MSEANGQPQLPHCEGTPSGQATIDPTRVAALYAEHGDELRRFILGVVRDPDLTRDVMQWAFTRAVERGHTARDETIKGWLFQVAFREALTARRRRESRDQAHRRFAALGLPSVGRPDEAILREETAAAVRKALDGLPPEQCRVVRARIYEDKTFAEIAREFGLPLGTVLTRMRRALEKLRRTLREGD